MKKTIYYTISGVLLGIAIDIPFMFSFGACALGGPQWCALLSLIALWIFPILGGIVGFLVAHKSIKKALAVPVSESEENVSAANRKLRKILFLSSLPLLLFLIWYVFNIISLTTNSNTPNPIQIMPASSDF